MEGHNQSLTLTLCSILFLAKLFIVPSQCNICNQTSTKEKPSPWNQCPSRRILVWWYCFCNQHSSNAFDSYFASFSYYRWSSELTSSLVFVGKPIFIPKQMDSFVTPRPVPQFNIVNTFSTKKVIRGPSFCHVVCLIRTSFCNLGKDTSWSEKAGSSDPNADHIGILQLPWPPKGAYHIVQVEIRLGTDKQSTLQSIEGRYFLSTMLRNRS